MLISAFLFLNKNKLRQMFNYILYGQDLGQSQCNYYSTEVIIVTVRRHNIWLNFSYK